MQAVVNFRTMQNGSYKYIRRGQCRGYWRVLVVKNPAGPLKIGTHNVVKVLYQGHPGILGVTEKSAYYLGGDLAQCERVAEEWNAETAR